MIILSPIIVFCFTVSFVFSLAGNMLTLLVAATKAKRNRRQTVERYDGEKVTL